MTQADTISRRDTPRSRTRTQGMNPLDRFAKRAISARLDRFARAGIRLQDAEGSEVLGNADATVVPELTVNDPAMYRRTLMGGGLGFAESYLDGQWESDDLTALLRGFVREIQIAHEHDRGLARLRTPLLRLGGLISRNTKVGSKRNIAAHYDLGNEFFRLWLDETMTYSSGIFPTPDATLREASFEKLDRICRGLNLTADDHVLETGTGWGSFALHAAGNYGCRVTTTTISQRQHEAAAQRIEEAGLGDRVTLLLRDYRDLDGQYDKLVSIEMIEAVGHDFLDTYLAQCARLLKPDGQMMLQVITMPDGRYKQYLRTSDFIRKHVFPGSCCPSLGALASSIARATDLRCVQYEDITPHYAKTLRCWHQQFSAKIDDVRALGYPERFIRLWNYYLCSCEAGFAERYIGVGQMLLNKPSCRLPDPFSHNPTRSAS